MPKPPPDITRLAQRWSAGDGEAFDELIRRVYPQLRVLAHRHLRHAGPDRTVSTTVLVHEAYLKLAGVDDAEWQDRAHFFAFCATVMRHLLVDFARRRDTDRRGGGQVQVTLTDDAAAADTPALEILALNQALDRLAERNERMARIVECRFFGGMSVAETAEALSASVRTVEREWGRARAYLHHALSVATP
ncbi:MAG: ECF-type sigma factor [Gemmatimonadota bacterium]